MFPRALGKGRRRWKKISKSFEVGMNGAEMWFTVTLWRTVKILYTTFYLFWFVWGEGRNHVPWLFVLVRRALSIRNIGRSMWPKRKEWFLQLLPDTATLFHYWDQGRAFHFSIQAVLSSGSYSLSEGLLPKHTQVSSTDTVTCSCVRAVKKLCRLPKMYKGTGMR